MKKSLVVVVLGIASVLGSPATAGAKRLVNLAGIADGRTYRVGIFENHTFKVTQKGMFGSGVSMEERARQRKALVAATGCEPRDEMMLDGKLRGQLECPDGVFEKLIVAPDVGTER